MLAGVIAHLGAGAAARAGRVTGVDRALLVRIASVWDAIRKQVDSPHVVASLDDRAAAAGLHLAAIRVEVLMSHLSQERKNYIRLI